MTSRPAASSRDNNFNLIRFMAALCVMIGHMSFIAPGPLYIFLGNGIQIMGVRTIFLLGGYLISKSWSSDPHVLRYAVKRAFRIWPALIVFTLGVTLVAGPILSVLPAGEYFRNPATWQYLGAIGFYISYGLPGVFADVPYAGVVNGSLWTMPLEVALYVLVPLVLWLVSRRPWRRHASLLTAIFVGLYVVAAVLRCAVFPQWRMVIYGLDVAQFLVLGVYYMLGMLYALPPGTAVFEPAGGLPAAGGGGHGAVHFLCGQRSVLHAGVPVFRVFPGPVRKAAVQGLWAKDGAFLRHLPVRLFRAAVPGVAVQPPGLDAALLGAAGGEHRADHGVRVPVRQAH